MSKAGEYGSRRPEDFKGALIHAYVGPDGQAAIENRSGAYIAVSEILAFARWILDTFGEPA